MAHTRAAVVAICHGAGPMPALGDKSHAGLINILKHQLPDILKIGTPQSPRAIALVTAHWQAKQPTISSGRRHELYYDYSGFPPASYSLKYDAPGDPEIAQTIFDRFEAFDLKPKLNPTRGAEIEPSWQRLLCTTLADFHNFLGWDHGTFIPMMLINANGSIPIVQVSVLASQSDTQLLKMGQALAQLREDNIAIIGSGSASCHNLHDWLTGGAYDSEFQIRHHEWAAVLEAALSEEKATARLHKLKRWREFPHSYEMHPDRAAEHFSPLLVCAAAAGDGSLNSSGVKLMGAEQKNYWWG